MIVAFWPQVFCRASQFGNFFGFMAPAGSKAAPRGSGFVANADKMTEKQNSQDCRQDLAWLIEEVKKSPELMKLCRATVLKYLKSRRSKDHLPRCVNTMKDVPHYRAQECIGHLLPEIDPADIENMNAQDCLHIIMLAFQMGLDAKLPEKEMKITDWLEWSMQRCTQMGYLIRHLKVCGPDYLICWTTNLGIFVWSSSKKFPL